jgi:hypothetical protein
MVAGSSPPLMRGTFITSGRRVPGVGDAPQVSHAALVQALLQPETVDLTGAAPGRSALPRAGPWRPRQAVAPVPVFVSLLLMPPSRGGCGFRSAQGQVRPDSGAGLQAMAQGVRQAGGDDLGRRGLVVVGHAVKGEGVRARRRTWPSRPPDCRRAAGRQEPGMAQPLPVRRHRNGHTRVGVKSPILPVPGQVVQLGSCTWPTKV